MTTLTNLDLEVVEHVIYRLANATVSLYPFPHFYIRDVFPTDFYGDLVRAVSAGDGYALDPEGRYHGRQFGPEDMHERIPGLAGFLSKRFLRAALMPFKPQFLERYAEGEIAVYNDLRFIRDGKDYFIGPHTDAPWKLVSLLFYLPIHDMYKGYGTSLYVPRDPDMTCAGGPHYDVEHFVRIHTAPYLPNSLLGFLKTDKSFHGVEPIYQDFQRDVLLWNAYDRAIYEQTHKKPSNAVDDAPLPALPSET